MVFMKAIVQKHELGCAVACVARVLDVSYQSALALFPDAHRAHTQGFTCGEIVAVLKKFHKDCEYKYVNKKVRHRIHRPGTIVFIARSKKYPNGHFLSRVERGWMDPWINFPQDKNISSAKAGFRRRLPGRPIYAILQAQSL